MNSSHTKIKQVGLLLTATSLLLAAKPAEAVVGDIASFTPSQFTQTSPTVTAVNSSNAINQASTSGGNGFGGFFTTNFLLLGSESTDTTIPDDFDSLIDNSFNDSIARSPTFTITQNHIDRNFIDVDFQWAFNGDNSTSSFDDFQVQLIKGSSTATGFSRIAPGGYGSGTATARFDTTSLFGPATNYRLQLVANESTSNGSSAAGFNNITVTSVPFEFSPAQGLLAVGGLWGISAFLKRRKAAAMLNSNLAS